VGCFFLVFVHMVLVLGQIKSFIHELPGYSSVAACARVPTINDWYEMWEVDAVVF
jgi:hypothetical protein